MSQRIEGMVYEESNRRSAGAREGRLGPPRQGCKRFSPCGRKWSFASVLLACCLSNHGLEAIAQTTDITRHTLVGDLSEPLRDDASLRAVAFADVDRGWAVGDRGVIWHTEDGGDSWQPQASGTPHTLFDVSFTDPRRGIAVGGWYEPHTRISHAVVLVTTNGGRSWEAKENDLPLLRRVALDRFGAVVVGGDYSALQLSCLFQSDDAGRHWTPLLSGELDHVQDFVGTPSGPLSVLGRGGMVFQYRDLAGPPQPSIASQSLRAVAGSEGNRWAVGRQGTAFLSQDAGAHWTSLTMPADLPSREWVVADAAAGFAWCIGQPGDLLLKIDGHGGQTVLPTPTGTAVRGIDFFDAQRGWAVGAFGTIMATRDGGKTWRFQRAPPRTAACLAVAADPARLPWPALGSESLEMGRRFAVCLHHSGEEAGPEQAGPPGFDPLLPATPDLLAQAAAGLGGGEVVEIHPDSHELGPAIEAVLQCYQPQVLILDAELDAEVRRSWTRLAMSRDVRRVLETCDREGSDLTVHGAAILPRAGSITDDLWREALGLLQPAVPCPEAIYLRCTYDSIFATSRSIDGLFTGLPVGDFASSRALGEQASRRLLQVLRARSGQRTLAATIVEEGNRRGAFTSRLDLLIAQTAGDARSRLLEEVLHHCRLRDRPELYRETLRAASRYLAHRPLGRLAKLRLQAIAVSGEWQMLQQANVARSTVATASATAGAVKLSPFAEQRQPIDPRDLVRTAETLEAGPVQPSKPDAVPAVESQQDIDLRWDFDPRVLLVRETIRRRDASADHQKYEQVSADLRRYRDAMPMQDWAELAGVAPEAEKQIAAAHQPPRLDGRLEEPFWAAADVLPLDEGFSLRIAYDKDYVYWGLEGPLPNHQPADEPTDGSRRDAALQDSQRVVLQIDVDGDLLTRFVLEVSPGGRTRDTCDGFTGWHPMWFVDSRVDQGRWVVEAAVRRKDLQELPLMAGDRWRFRCAIVPPGEAWGFDALPSADRWTTGRFQ